MSIFSWAFWHDKWWYLIFWSCVLIVVRLWLVNPLASRLDAVIALLKRLV